MGIKDQGPRESGDLVRSVHLTDRLVRCLTLEGGRFGFVFNKRLEWVNEYPEESFILGMPLTGFRGFCAVP